MEYGTKISKIIWDIQRNESAVNAFMIEGKSEKEEGNACILSTKAY